jgi:hypothetical protein
MHTAAPAARATCRATPAPADPAVAACAAILIAGLTASGSAAAGHEAHVDGRCPP